GMVSAGQFITATATDPNGNTSEFSNCVGIGPPPCAYSIAPTTQSFDSNGGIGSVNVNAAGGCPWSAASNANWILITSGDAASGDGSSDYFVIQNTAAIPRSGTLTVAGQTFTVSQTGTQSVLQNITDASVSGKNLIVEGSGFDGGATIVMNHSRQTTVRNTQTPNILTGKKVAKRMADGQTVILQVQNSDGSLSPEFIFTRGASLGLQLSANSALPGDTLLVTSNGFSADDDTTYVIFTDPSGRETRVHSIPLTPTTLSVAVPVYLDFQSGQISPGIVSVSVIQQPNAGIVVFGPVSNFAIADLPQSGYSPGTVTLEVLKQLQNLLTTTSESWALIGSASSGAIDTSTILSELTGLQAQVLDTENSIQQVLDGETPTLAMGKISGRDLVIDQNSLAVADRMFVAYLLNGEAGANSVGNAAGINQQTVFPGDCSDLTNRIGQQLNPNVGTSLKEVFDKFDKLRKIGETGLGVLEVAGAAGLSLPIDLEVAGAAFFFGSTVVPGAIALSAFALAAPFIENELGRPITSEDYLAVFKYIKEGSWDFFFGQYLDALIGHTLPNLGADEAVTAFLSKSVPFATGILKDLDIDDPASLPSQAFGSSGSIFSNMPRSYHTLSISKIGDGTGTVSESDPGIKCSDPCSGAPCLRYPSGSPVTLTAAADDGSKFVEWGGACSGTGPCMVFLDADKTVTANFMRIVCQYALSQPGPPFSAAGGTGSLTVTAQSGCTWAAMSQETWITVISGSSGRGTQTWSYSVAPNSGADQRTGTIAVAGQTLTVTQDGTNPGGSSLTGTWVGTWTRPVTGFCPAETSSLRWTLTQTGTTVSGSFLEVVTGTEGDLCDPINMQTKGDFVQGVVSGNTLTILTDSGTRFSGSFTSTTISGTGGGPLGIG
ncbi:MAG: BACON domain-containing protein, partial [Blastocatellia bacterium]